MSERRRDDPPGPITANEWFLAAEARARRDWERKQRAQRRPSKPSNQAKDEG